MKNTKKQLVEMVEELNELMKDAISCKKLVDDLMNKTKGFDEWAAPDDCDGNVVKYVIHLEEEIKKLKEEHQEQIEFYKFVPPSACPSKMYPDPENRPTKDEFIVRLCDDYGKMKTEIKGYQDLEQELLKKIEELKEQGKKDLEQAYLETQFHTWRDEYLSRGGHNDANDECEYLNLYSDNQQLIKEIFDEIYSDHTERDLSYNVETRTYDELSKYEKEDSEWVWGYGAHKKDNEYVINISGGGDGVSPNGFEDWVIKKIANDKLGYYIRHGGQIVDALQVGKKLVSCPDGNYVSFQDTDYELCENADGDQEADFEWLEYELSVIEED